MSLPVLIGFAGVLVAAVVTGMLAGQCVRQPRIGSIVWTVASLGLTIALAVQSMGFASGFSPVTFRAVQLFALLLAPLWLAWGLVELVAVSEAVRFGTRLISSAMTVVASVILATDPLTAQPFSKSWPLTGPHFQPISHYALDVVQAVAVVAVMASAGMAAARARSDAPWRPTIAAVVAVSLAVFMTAGLRFPLPASAVYPLLSMLAAALVWFGASRVGGLPRQVTGRDGRPDGRRDGMRDGRSRGDRSGSRRDDYRPDDAYRPGDDHAADVQYATYGQRGGPPGPGRPRGAGDITGAGPAARSASGHDHPRRVNSGPQPGSAGGSAAATPARPYGRILIFTLLDDRAADFDRLAEQAAEEVRTGEPDTLVYVIHLVPNAPLQRIFYEIYRDRAAFDSHENQPYMQRFVADRRSCVLATNVIELRLKYAKVAPLPSPQASAPVPPPATRAQLPPGHLGPPQRLQPLPPLQPQRPDQQRPDQRRPDQRRVPPAGRRYEG